MRDRLIELLQEASTEAGKHFRETTKKVLAEKGRFNSATDIDRRNIYEVEADYLLENGVIVPPCKVGQTVYRATKLVNGDEFVTEGIIFEVSSTYENGTAKTRFYFWAKGDEWKSRHYSLWCDLTEFGKTVFLTKEEAEQALKGGAEE